jgi:hypothetical protein
VFDVSKHGEVISRNLAIAGIGGDHVNLTFGNRPVHEFRLHLPLVAKLQTIGGPQRGPLRSRKNLIVARDTEFTCVSRQIGDRANIQSVGLLFCHRQCIGILESKWPDHVDMLRRREPPRKFREHRLACRHIFALHAIGPKRAGVIDRDVHFARS